MLASFINLAVARPPQFSVWAHGPQCPKVSKATGRFTLAGIKRSANGVRINCCQTSLICWQNAASLRIISLAKCGYRWISNSRRSRWCSVSMGFTSIENICHFTEVNNNKTTAKSKNFLPFSSWIQFVITRLFSSSTREVRKRSHSNFNRPLSISHKN